MTRIVALGITALVACSSTGAAETREVHIDVGSSRAPLMATVHVEDYRAAPLDLFTAAAPGDSRMTRFLKTYLETGRAGDTKKFASLFGPEVHADADDHETAVQELKEGFLDLRSVRMLTVLHWGEYQIGFVAYQMAIENGGTRRWTVGHAARCVGNMCQITGHFANSQLGRKFAAAFAEKGEVRVAMPAPGETLLSILPAVDDATQKAAATDPIVLHLNRASEETTLAVTKVASTSTEPGTVSGVYSLGPDVCVALLKSGKDGASHWLPLQRTGSGWAIISDPSSLDAWQILSSISTYRALQNR